MNQKVKKLVIAAGAAFALIIIGIILILVQVNELRNTTGATTINGMDTKMEAPSILSDSNVDFAGKNSLSTEKGTIGVTVSATPIEFKEGTKARVKIDGKSHALKRKDNSFAGTFHVSAFKSIGPVEVIFEDGETVRSEYIDDIGLSAFLPVNFTWSADGNEIDFNKDTVKFDKKMIYSMRYEDEALDEGDGPPVQVRGVIEGKQVYKKTFELANMTANSMDLAFDWKDEIELPEGKTLVVYLETKDEYGLVYRYKFGQLSKKDQGETFGDQAYQKIEVVNPKGNVIFSEKVNDIIEEDEE